MCIRDSLYINENTYGQEEVSQLVNKHSNPKLFKEKLKNWKDYSFKEAKYSRTDMKRPYKDECPWKKQLEIQVVSDMTVWPCCWTSHHHYQYWIGDEKLWNTEKVDLDDEMLSKNIKYIKQWQKLMNPDSSENFLDNKDIKITDDHLLYDVLASKTFKHINDKMTYGSSKTFTLDICSETCRTYPTQQNNNR